MQNHSSYKGLRVLVTGASGFIGQHVIRELRRNEAIIYGVSRTTRPDDHDSTTWVSADLTDEKAVRRAFDLAQPDVVFHLASYVAGARGIEYVTPTLQANLLAAVNVMNIASQFASKRIVTAGSMEEPRDSDNPAVPSSPYAAAKWAATAYARMFRALYELPIVVARIFMVYGPSQRDALKLIPYVIDSLLAGRVPEVTTGDRPIDWIYVDDVVDGLLMCGSVDGIEGHCLDIGSGNTRSVRQIVESLVRLVNSTTEVRFGARPKRKLETVRSADVDTTFTRLGWRASTELESGLAQTVRWHRNNAK